MDQNAKPMGARIADFLFRTPWRAAPVEKSTMILVWIAGYVLALFIMSFMKIVQAHMGWVGVVILLGIAAICFELPSFYMRWRVRLHNKGVIAAPWMR